MKNHLCLTFLFISSSIISSAQLDVTNTGTIKITSVSDTFFITGNFTNAISATLNNNGNLYVKGNITNNQSTNLSGTGTIFLTGISTQNISSTSAFTNITINKTAGSVALLTSSTINGLLNLSSITSRLSIGTNNLTLNGTVTGSGFLRGSLTSNLSITGTGSLGTINFDQTTDGTTNALSSFTINRTSAGTLSLGNKLVLIDVLTPTAGVLTTGGFLHLRSNATNTARIAAGTAPYISGNVIAERYLTANANRAYRLLGPIVTTSGTIKDNWQEGVNNTVVNTNVNSPIAGYGTHITGTGGSANGFDVTQNNQASLYSFSQAAQDWVGVTNTNVNTLNAQTGYLIFVRGNRDNIATINTTTGSSNATLRATGTLSQGTQTFSSLANSTLFSLVTNPYASPISWGSIYTGANATNFENTINIWDPNVNTRGGYITINNSGTTGGGTTNLNLNIQSGQAFFIQTKSGINSPTFTLLESNKSTSNNLDVYRTGPQTEKLKINLNYTNAGVERSADGVTVLYKNGFSNAVDGNDAEQIANWDEDVSLLRGGKELSIESRDLVDANDTLFLNINRVNKTSASYKWEIEPQSFNAPGIQAWMKDNFTNTSTPVSLSTNTVIPFTVTADVASQASNRFSVVFKNNAALPVTISNVKAYTKNSGVQVEWQTNNEINIESYEVEKSSNAINFATMHSQQATGSNQYQSFDANPSTGNNFYRIKAIEKSGKTSYTQIVKVTIGQTKSAISIYPNPVTNNQVGLQLSQIAKGNYQVRIINKAGQTVFTKTIVHAGGTASHQLQFGNTVLSSGVYQIVVEGEGIQFTQTLLKQ